jgi:hypothetical protein
VIPAGAVAYLVFPQQPFYPDLVYDFADQPCRVVRRDEFVHAGRNETRLSLVVGFVGYLVSDAFADGNSIAWILPCREKNEGLPLLPGQPLVDNREDAERILNVLAARLSRALATINTWCRANRHESIREQWETLKVKLNGHYAYYGISLNFRSIAEYTRNIFNLCKAKERGTAIGSENTIPDYVDPSRYCLMLDTVNALR